MNANNADPPNANAKHTFQYENVANASNWKKVTSNQYPKVTFYEKANQSNRRWTHPNEEEDAYKFVNVVENNTLPAGWRKLVHKEDPGFEYFEEEATGESTFRRPAGPVASLVASPVNNSKPNVATSNSFRGVMNKISALEDTLETMEQTLKNAKANTTPPALAGGRRRRRLTKRANKRRARKTRKTKGRR
jgi:hypothetical protein